MPTTVASTSHLAQIVMNVSTSSGRTTAIIRSWLSLMRISSGESVGSRSTILFSRTSRFICRLPVRLTGPVTVTVPPGGAASVTLLRANVLVIREVPVEVAHG